MSVRTWDPKQAEIFPTGHCSEAGCGQPYHTICSLCNLAYCFGHLPPRKGALKFENGRHACNTGVEFLVLTPEEVEEIYGANQ